MKLRRYQKKQVAILKKKRKSQIKLIKKAMMSLISVEILMMTTKMSVMESKKLET